MTHVAAGEGAGHGISIHTFLTEGDVVSVRCAGAMVISIHTFLAEGDNKLAVARYTLAVFQSTPSLQKVTEAGCRCGELYRISIHTFLAEGDHGVYEYGYRYIISIHTFLAEGDGPASTPCQWQKNFNPHLPCGR